MRVVLLRRMPSHRDVPQPVSAPWAIAALRGLGAEFLAWVLCDASTERRQVVFAIAAHGWLDHPEAIVAQLAPDRLHQSRAALSEVLITHDLRSLVRAAFGHCPDGYLGGLRRAGPDAFSRPEMYSKYFALFADPAVRNRRKIAQHLGSITEAKIEMLLEVDAALLNVSFFSRLSSIEEVRAINSALAAVRSVSDREHDAALVAAATDGGDDRKVEQFITAWIRRCRFPALPFEADPGFGVSPIQDAGRLLMKSLQYRNCARGLHRVVDAIAGRSAYVVYEPNGQPTAMALLYRLTNGGWLVEGVYGVSNSRVPAEVQRPFRAWLESRGVTSLDRPKLTAEWKTVLSLVGQSRWAELEPEHDLLAA